MTVTSATRQADGDDVFTGTVESDEIVHRYKLTTDGTETESYQVVTNGISAGLLPAPGKPIAAGVDYWARRIKVWRPIRSTSNVWYAEVTYDNKPAERSQDSSDDPQRYDPTDPDNDTAIVSLAAQMVQRPEMFDFRGAACNNTAGDLIDPLPELNYVLTTITIEWNSTSAVTAFRQYIGTSNDQDITLTGIAVKERQGAVTGYETTGPHTRQYTPIGGTPTQTTYYTHRVSYEFIDIDLPSNVNLLDPANATISATALPSFPALKRDSDAVDYNYIPQGHIVANVGYSELRLDAPSAYSTLTDYEIGDTVTYGGARHKCLLPNGPTEGTANPSNTTYWEQYGTGNSAPLKHRLTNGDVNPSLTGDSADDYVDRPQYLDDAGQFHDPMASSGEVYALFFSTFKAEDWSALPGVS